MEESAEIDADINTHNGDTNAHGPIRQQITDHAANPSAHHDRYTNAEAEAVASSVVSTHSDDESAHHTKYTDNEARTASSQITTWGHTSTVISLNADMVDGIHASSSPEASKLVPLGADAKFPTSVIPLKVYDSGWFPIESRGAYSKTHNLGTTKVLAIVYGATDINGSNMGTCSVRAGETPVVSQITTTTCVVYAGIDIGWIWNGSAYVTPTHARVIMKALE